MKFKFKITTSRLVYDMRANYLLIIFKAFGLLFILSFIYLCVRNIITMYELIRLLIICALLVSYRIFWRLTLHLIISKIESLSSIDDKKRLVLRLTQLHHKSNPFIYFIITNSEFFIKFRRWFYDLLKYHSLKVIFTDVFLFFFYYPFTRLNLLWIRFYNRLYLISFEGLLSIRIQSYIIFGLVILPFVWQYFVYIKFWQIILFYYCILTFIVPILRLFLNYSHEILVIVKSLRNSTTSISGSTTMVSKNKRQFFLNISDTYPTVAYIMEQRKSTNIFGVVISYYKSSNIFPKQVLNLKSCNLTLDLPTWNSFFFYSLGTFDCRIDVWRYCYLNPLLPMFNDFYYLENNRYISYYWYEELYYNLLSNWNLPYIAQLLYNMLSKEENVQDLLAFLQTCIDKLIKILELQFKLIWDIEKDWGLNPFDAYPVLKSQLLKKGRCYPIYEDTWPMLLSDNRGSLKVELTAYSNIVNNYSTPKFFNKKLEESLINYMLDYYLDCAFFGSFFDDYGKYFIADIKACCSNKLHFDVLMLESIQLKLKQEKYDELFGDIDVHYGSDDYGINSYVRHKIGQDVAKWRQEWQK